MLPYLEIHREQLILLFGYGFIGIFGLVFAIYAKKFAIGASHEDHDNKEEPLTRFPDGVEEGHGKVPMFLILLYIFLGVWVVVYIGGHASGFCRFAG
mgnify:CR=1 FL=1